MGSYYDHGRCVECGCRLTASDEGFDGLCAVCAAASGTCRKVRRRRSVDRQGERVGAHRLLDVDALEWVSGLLGA